MNQSVELVLLRAQEASFLSDPDPKTLNSIINSLWLSSDYLTGQGSESKGIDATTYGILMQSIQQFMAQFPSGTVPTDPYLKQIYSALTATSGSCAKSLASLASDYKPGTDPSVDLAIFNNEYLSPSGDMNFAYSALTNDLASWGQHESGFNPNPQSLTKSDFEPFLDDLQLLSPSSTDFRRLFSDIGYVVSDLNGSSKPLDGACQELLNLLQTPLIPGNANSTLALLSKNNDSATMQSFLTSPNATAILEKIQSLAKEIGAFEGWN